VFEEALEFFLKVLQHVSRVLSLPIAVGSKTVGKEVGKQESPEKLYRVMRKWRKVWDHDEVRKREELVLPVAVDDRKVPRDWMCVVVRSCVAGEKLGDAKQLHVDVYDSMQRGHVAKRVARNLDVLVRGIEARSDVQGPEVQFVKVPECRVDSQRILYAFGRLLGRVAVAGGVEPLDASSEAFLPDVGHAARALFAHLRQELGEWGARDVATLLKDVDTCRRVLTKFNTVPSLLSSTGGR
jgi:hypothetical protein